jgi:hypothetical protein
MQRKLEFLLISCIILFLFLASSAAKADFLF